MISPRHGEARKAAPVVRQQLKSEGAISAEDHVVTVLRRIDLKSEARRDLLHYAPSRVVGFHMRTATWREEVGVATRSAFQKSKSQTRAEMQPHLWAARQAKITRDMGMER